MSQYLQSALPGSSHIIIQTVQLFVREFGWLILNVIEPGCDKPCSNAPLVSTPHTQPKGKQRDLGGTHVCSNTIIRYIISIYCAPGYVGDTKKN